MLVLAGCPSYAATDPPTSLRECREQAYGRFDACMRGVARAQCQSNLGEAIDTCIEAFPEERVER